MTNRPATLTQKSDYADQWQAFNPAHLPGLLMLRHLTSSS